jgi:hypothetical protein
MSEPILMPFQDEPFNGDPYVQVEFLNLRDRFSVRNVIETGSCLFTTTKWFSRNFSKVYTFEINPEFYNIGKTKVEDSEHVESHNTDSVSGLKSIIGSLSGQSLFFLDAHWGENCPLLDELDVISGCKIPPIIAIHDFKTDDPSFGFDSYGNREFDLNYINLALMKIYPKGFDYYYNLKGAGAKRGLIYILSSSQEFTPINRRIQGI